MDSRYAKIKSKGAIIRAGLLVCMGFILLSEMAFGAQATASLLKHSSIDQRLVVSVNFENEQLADVLHKLARKVDVGISYKTETVPDKMVTYQARNVSVYSVLDAVLKDTGLYATLSKNRKVILIKQRYLQKVAKLQSTISGTVTDAGTGETLPGVNIQVKGTTTGTSTDSKGHYELSAESLQDTLIFSFVGYQTKELPIKGRTSINIVLKSQVISGQELVVTALGVKQKKESLSYSSQDVNVSQVQETSPPNVMVSLEGKVAGLSITQSSGGVGSPTRVILRGNRSINGNNQPLYIIDGVPTRGNPETLDPNNIASINVLKGANAAAIYGSEAQNGAIIIETKTAKRNEITISFNNNFIFNEPIIRYQYQNVYGQGNGGVYSSIAQQSWGPKMEGQMVDTWSIDPNDAGKQYALLPQPNNVRDFFQRGYNLSNNLNVGIGGEKTQTMLSFTHTNAQGIFPNNNLKRYNISLRVKSQVRNWISLDGKINYINQTRDGNTSSRNNGSEAFDVYTIPRSIRTVDVENYDFYNENGNLKQNFWDPNNSRLENPYWAANRILPSDGEDRIIAMGSATLDFTDALSLIVRGSYDGANTNSNQKTYNDTYEHGHNGEYSINDGNDFELNSDFLLTYSQDVTKNWNINANVGGSIKKSRNHSVYVSTGDLKGNPGLVLPNIFSLSNTLLPTSSNILGSPVDVNSLYAFAKIGWKDAIYFNLSGRNDWSSTLPADSRSYFYPSAGVSAILSNLIPAFPDIFSFAKVRFSWAKVGSGAPYGMLQRTLQFTAGGSNGFLGVDPTLPDKSLKPEETESYEAGLNIKFLENRIGLDISAYKENTRNQLFTIDVPVGSGETQYFTNGGNVQNKGLEAVLTTTPVRTRNFKWDFDVNFSLNRSKIISLSQQRQSLVLGGGGGSGSGWASKLIVGQPWGNIYTTGYVRDDQGRVIVNSNGTPQYTSGFTVLVGNYNPDWTASLSNTFSYKHISLHFLITHNQGGVIYSNTDATLAGLGLTKRTLQGRNGGLIFGKNFFPNETVVKQDGSPNDIKMNAETFWNSVGSIAYNVGEPFVGDATNMKLRELTIGYSLSNSILSKVGLSAISSLKISLVGRNLFYLYRASPSLDPDIRNGTGNGSGGLSSFVRPSLRSFGANLSIKF